MSDAGNFRHSVHAKGLSLGLLVAALIWTLCVSGAASAQTGFRGPGLYEITNFQSGKTLDLDQRDGTSVIESSSQRASNQRWDISPAGGDLFYIRNEMNGDALEAVRTRNSTSVRAAPYTGSSSQQWRLDAGQDGAALITSQLGKTLAFRAGAARDGVRVRMYNVSGRANQYFRLRRVSGSASAGNGGWRDSRRDQGRNTGLIGSTLIACSSANGRRVYCDTDTSRGVRLTRQMSAAACNQNSTWGYDSRGVWVDQGCSTEFDVSAPAHLRQTSTIASGTRIAVQNNEAIDATQTDGRVFSGVVHQVVLDGQGRVAIPRGSDVEMMVRADSNQELALDLESVTVNRHRYVLAVSPERLAQGGQKDGIGQNRRTAEYLGGGALLGTIIGAIAGGGKGAAIGAAVGAAAGAGTQVLTRGKIVSVPAESLLTFRLEQALAMGLVDAGSNSGRRNPDPRP